MELRVSQFVIDEAWRNAEDDFVSGDDRSGTHCLMCVAAKYGGYKNVVCGFTGITIGKDYYELDEHSIKMVERWHNHFITNRIPKPAPFIAKLTLDVPKKEQIDIDTHVAV